MLERPAGSDWLDAPALDIAARVFFVTVGLIIHDFRYISRPGTLAESAVTASKLDNSSFPTSVVEVGSNSSAVTGATIVSTTFAFVNGSTYLITGKTQQSSSSDGGVWVNTLEVNGVSIDTARYGGTLGTQMPATMIKVYVAAATASYTVSMVASRLSGSGTVNVEVPTIQIVPLLH